MVKNGYFWPKSDNFLKGLALKNANENATNNPVLFWKLLKSSTDDIKHCESSKTPSASQWLNHFEKLHSEHTLTKKQEEILKQFNEYEGTKHNCNELDQTIRETELLNATKKLKTKKASYIMTKSRMK